MNATVRSYLKVSIKGFLFSLIFPFIIYFLVHDKSYVYYSVAFNILGLIPGYYKYKDGLEFEEKLKRKGLSILDLSNIKFVKSWDAIRERGLIKYSLVDGGIFFGFALCGILSILVMIMKKGMMNYISADLSNMFNFIGYTYLAGATIGIVIYRILWVFNEQKFIRLTDPLR